MYETVLCTWTNTKSNNKINSIQDIWQTFNKYLGYKLLLHKTTWFLSKNKFMDATSQRASHAEILTAQ